MALQTINGTIEVRAPGDFIMKGVHCLLTKHINVYVAYAKNGDMYRGEMEDKNRQGTGMYYRYDGTMYVGTHDNSYFKNGKLTFTDGTVYEGDFIDDKYHGSGKYQGVQNNIPFTYEGEFTNGMCDGIGTVTMLEITIKGQFIENRFNGVMTIIRATGTSTAVFNHGTQMNHPPGRFVPVNNGVSVNGDFIEGDYITDDGVVYSGNWDKFQLQNGVVTKNGKIEQTFVHGKEILK